MNNLDKIKNEIDSLGPDIKAEVIVSLLVQRGVPWQQMVVLAKDFFFRRFSKDITSITVEDVAGLTDELHIHLSRTGIYDLLPEGIFFTPAAAGKTPKSAFEMAQEYKQDQIREAQARKFFAPFENAFFRQRVNNFTAEVALLNGLKDESLNRFFFKFWNLPQNMPPAMAIKLIVLLPYVHQVTGDAALMAACLQSITGKKVSCKIFPQAAQDTGLAFNILGHFELGNELTCGKEYFEEELCFEFTIYLGAEAAAADYLPGGNLYPVLETFRRFFLPVQADMTMVIQLPQEKEQMQPGNSNGAILGVATVI